MLSKSLKMKLMGQIKEYTIEELNQTSLNIKDNEYLFGIDLIETLIDELNNRLEEKRRKPNETIKKLVYLIYDTYIQIIEYHGKILLIDEIYEILLNLKDKYISAIKEVDKIDIKTLDELYKHLNQGQELIDHVDKNNYKETQESTQKDDNKEINKYRDKIKRLEEKCKKLQDRISSFRVPDFKDEKEQYESRIKELEHEITKLNDTVSDLNDTIEQNGITLETNKSYIEKVQSKIQRLQQIEQLYYGLQKEVNSYTNEIQNLNSENKTLRKEKERVEENYQKKLKKRDDDKKKNDMIDNHVLSCLIGSKYSLDKIVAQFKEFSITKKDVLASLNRLRVNYQIKQDSLSNGDLLYGLGVKKDNLYYINDNKDYFDMIVLSDMHICHGNMTEYIDIYKMIYEYAAKNSINIILNAGDFFNFLSSKNVDVETLKQEEEFIMKVIESLPYDPLINNLILGGNHDSYIHKLGIDPIDRLCANRTDYGNLGYQFGLISLSNNNYIGIHHYGNRITENLTGNFKQVDGAITSLLVASYRKHSHSRKQTYVDLLGHYHTSRVTLNNSYIMLPSLTCDRLKNSALRLRIFLDSNRKISHMEIIPFLVEDNLNELMSINYQKIKNI